MAVDQNRSAAEHGNKNHSSAMAAVKRRTPSSLSAVPKFFLPEIETDRKAFLQCHCGFLSCAAVAVRDPGPRQIIVQHQRLSENEAAAQLQIVSCRSAVTKCD
jgi:hypothetical protein